jgi:hypothetical protein
LKTDSEHRHDSRSKVVSFRISDAEYESAMALCRTYGYRGLSGLARSAFLAFRPRAEVAAQKNNALTQNPGIEHYQLRTLLAELNHLISSLQRGIQETVPDENEQ